MQGWLIALAAFGYLALLFAVAAYGDRRLSALSHTRPRPNIYALSVAVYCTSWTFFGSVGLASERGFEYFAIFLGPILVFTFGLPFVRRIVRLSKSERIISVADFLASRFGKNSRVAALATVIAVVGTVPYIALQLKAISDSVTLMVTHYNAFGSDTATLPIDVALIVAITLTVFAILFGTRHADATEHQNGLILAVAVESLIKIAAFLAVGIAVMFFLNGGIEPILEAARSDERVRTAISSSFDPGTWLVLTILSSAAVIMLPRQFHVIAVENRTEVELNRASWLFPVYLVAINALVVPIAIAGMIHVNQSTPADLYVLALPLQAGQDWLALVAFVGGLSAATAMVIVATVALSIMISNDIVLPLMAWRFGGFLTTASGNWSQIILNIRRASIAVVILAAFAYYQETTHTARLASIGLLSFAAIAQFMPAMLLGLYWRGANARGALAGLSTGFVVWAYTLLLPTIVGVGSSIVTDGPFGIASLKPQSLFGLDMAPLSHGVMWSLTLNVAFVVIGSLTRRATPLERMQAVTFIPRDQVTSPTVRRFRTTVSNVELKETIARYVGRERMERAFDAFERRENRRLIDAEMTDVSVVRYAEQILASAIGASSARLVLSLLLEKDGTATSDTIRLLDDASEALQQNRGLLQLALDQMDQGISVFDRDFRLSNWNGQFRRLLELPPELGQFGMPLKTIMSALAEKGQISNDEANGAINHISSFKRAWQLSLAKSGRILEVRSNPMPDGGIVVTYTDITGRVEADEALKRAKESLEQRVQARTSELTKVNQELARAQEAAETANIGKTRFLAAAGHDITQPLNAARLYTSSLVERMAGADTKEREIALKIDSALESVESIIGAVLDISRLDAGALTPNASRFSLSDLFEQVRNDFSPAAAKAGLTLVVVPSSIVVETDRNLLMRLVQNLVSNAIKYTREGRVLLGARRQGGNVSICVHDTGIGIPAAKMKSVFREFERLSEGARIAGGLGLGLSIVDRISRVLDLEVKLSSVPGRGTAFSVVMPICEAPLIAAEVQKTPLKPSRSLLNGVRIACIDNEETIVAGMTVLLNGWGAHVVAAQTRDELIARLAEEGEKPAVIIADYHLDDDTGLDVIDVVREIYGSETPAILVTADRSTDLRELAGKANVSLVNKPVKPAALRAILLSIPSQQAAAE